MYVHRTQTGSRRQETGRELANRSVSSGFTLVELLVVVAIIGILAAIALPRIAQAIETAKQGRTVSRLNLIRGATRMYFSDHMDGEAGYYPFTLNEITGCNIHPTNPHVYLYPDGGSALGFPYSNLPDEEVGDGPQAGDQITDYCDLAHTFHTERRVQSVPPDGAAPADKGGWNWCGGTAPAVGTLPTQYLPSGNVWIDENVMMFSGKNANWM